MAQIRSLYVRLSAVEFESLRRMATAERRSMPDQAAVLVATGCAHWEITRPTSGASQLPLEDLPDFGPMPEAAA
jgi:hypothetical protein